MRHFVLNEKAIRYLTSHFCQNKEIMDLKKEIIDDIL